MKYAREMKVGALAIVCLGVLFFGFHYLKGVNIFSATHSYHGYYAEMRGLEEQSPVLIRGYKVGQVDHITYDFSRDSAFLVDISVDKHIRLPKGTRMGIIPNGLLGSMAIELQLPTVQADFYEGGEFLPTLIVPGLMDNLKDSLLGSLGETIENVNGLILNISSQLDSNRVANVLENADALTSNLTVVSHDMKRVVGKQIPALVEHADSLIAGLDGISASIAEADIVGKVDSTVANVNGLISDARSEEGTIGKLLYDKSLYKNINAAVGSADSLLTDIKAHPRHYLYPLGAKEKKKK